jgi:transcriptional activator of cad operon
MDRPTTIPLRIGDWRFDPRLGQLTRDGHTQRLEARTLRLLTHLVNRAGETVSIDELLDQVWSGVVVTQDSVYQAVTALRRMLGDDPKQPSYIATVPRLGYRLVARVSAWEEPEPAAAQTAAGAPAAAGSDATAASAALPVPSPTRRNGRRALWGVAAFMLLAVTGVLAWRGLAPDGRTVAVLPFLDLTTQEMNEEYFADGMTEELIHRLSKLPGFEVPSPTASFYYKGRQLPPATIAEELGVDYLLDGSLRESGHLLRVSARLVRARDGVVVWSQNYDRPKTDRLMIQDDIASEVTRALDAAVR